MARFVNRLRGMHAEGDARQLVVAWGAWGATAGRPGAVCNRGLPPCIGAGLVKEVAKHCVVALTNERNTSKTCPKCYACAGAWAEKEELMGRKVRGLRVCQDEGCSCPFNRDRGAAANIGEQFKRIHAGRALLGAPPSTDDERLDALRAALL